MVQLADESDRDPAIAEDTPILDLPAFENAEVDPCVGLNRATRLGPCSARPHEHIDDHGTSLAITTPVGDVYVDRQNRVQPPQADHHPEAARVTVSTASCTNLAPDQPLTNQSVMRTLVEGPCIALQSKSDENRSIHACHFETRPRTPERALTDIKLSPDMSRDVVKGEGEDAGGEAQPNKARPKPRTANKSLTIQRPGRARRAGKACPVGTSGPA